MTTSTDIANRALQLVGTRTTVASLAEASNEAIQINLVYDAIAKWCHAINNWNFARKTAILVAGKTLTTPTGTWLITDPPPPWLFEYKLPTDFLRAIYLTNNDDNAAHTAYQGKPQRFVIATDNPSSTAQSVLLTNQSVANLNYISYVSDPTLWPPFFERFTVATLAQTVCFALTGDKELTAWCAHLAQQFYSTAELLNRAEGLIVDDTTPELIQMVGIGYPQRRDLTPRIAPGETKRQ